MCSDAADMLFSLVVARWSSNRTTHIRKAYPPFTSFVVDLSCILMKLRQIESLYSKYTIY